MCRRNKLSLVWTCAERCYLLSRRQSLVKRYYRETCGSHFCNSADCNARTMGERRYVRHKNEGRNNKFVRNVGHHTKGETFSHTYLLTPWCRLLLEKLTGLQLLKKFPAFHGTRRFITALTSVRHLSLSWASPIQSIHPHPISWRSILILSTHLRLGLPSGLLPSGFPSKTLYRPTSPHPYAPHVQSISFFSILSPAQYWARSTQQRIQIINNKFTRFINGVCESLELLISETKQHHTEIFKKLHNNK